MDDVRRILESSATWAIVGLSDKPERASWHVASFLAERGYKVVPVNPRIGAWRGVSAYPDLGSIPFPIDVVDLFRRSEAVPTHADEAIALHAKALWMQLGVRHEAAAARARAAGLLVVQDRCPIIETRRVWPAGDGPRFGSEAGQNR
jgi:predicted CoA-binding protein